MTLNYHDFELVMSEARRLRGVARSLPDGEVRKDLEDAADRLEQIAHGLPIEAVTTEKAS